MRRADQPAFVAPPPALELPPLEVIYESDPRDIRLIEALERNVKHLEQDIKHLEKLAEEAIEAKNKIHDECRRSIDGKDKYIAMLELENNTFSYGSKADLGQTVDFGLGNATNADDS